MAGRTFVDGSEEALRARQVGGETDGSAAEPLPQGAYPRYRVEPGGPFSLADVDPNESEHYRRKKDVEEELEAQRKRISGLQERLYAENKQGLLIVLQAMDTGGKDGTIKHVLRGVNPQGCRVSSFKAPSAKEANHDFLWRYHKSVPARGRVGIFNRSHYEDVLIVRVKDLVPEDVWRPRYGLINGFENSLASSGITVLKFFCISLRTSRNGASRAGSTTRRSAGSSPPPTSRSARTGTITGEPSRTP